MRAETKKTLKASFITSLPVMAGYVVLGIGFGILLAARGYGLVWALSMSIFVYAGTMQYVGVSLLGAGASILATALTTVMVNARHLFYSISMVDRYKGAGKKKLYLIFSLTDETYSLLCDGRVPNGCSPHLYRFFVSLFNQVYWVSGSAIGSILGQTLSFNSAGVEFSMTALFVAAFTQQWLEAKTLREHIPALIGISVSAVCLLVFGSQNFLIPSMLIITAVLTAIRRPLKNTAETHEQNTPHTRVTSGPPLENSAESHTQNLNKADMILPAETFESRAEVHTEQSSGAKHSVMPSGGKK